MRRGAVFVFASLTGVSSALAATAPIANAQGVVMSGDSIKRLILTATDVPALSVGDGSSPVDRPPTWTRRPS